MKKERIPPALVAAYLILQRNEQVLLLRRFNTGYEDGNYSLIAGHVETGEQITECILREAKEEANIIVKNQDLTFIHVMQRSCSDQLVYLDFFFVCKNWDGALLNMELSKCDDLAWFSLNELPQNLIPHVKKVLETLSSPTSQFSEIGW